ncbi:MAG: hypothetical protein ACTHJ8_11795 [Mucilaginibacter sp.]|jgi:hypothetical protein
MTLPFAFVFIAAFILLAIFLIVRRSLGKKDLRKDIEDKKHKSGESGVDKMG